MFDLPVLTADNRREYRKFQKYLVKSGYLMMQESVYSKIAMNSTTANALINNIKKNKPKFGLVQVLKVSEKQYSNMVFVVGESTTDVLDTSDKVVVL